MKVPISREERVKRFWQARRGWGYSKDMTRTEYLKMRDKAYMDQKKKEEAARRKQAAASKSKAAPGAPGAKKKGKLIWIIILLLILVALYYYLKYVRNVTLPF